MKHIKKSQMLFVEGITGEDFQRKYNAAMQDLSSKPVAIDDKILSLEKLSAVILYTVSETIPETIKDQYELQGKYPTCGECPHFKFVTNHTGDCPYLKFHKKGGVHFASEDICDRRWKEIEELEKEDSCDTQT